MESFNIQYIMDKFKLTYTEASNIYYFHTKSRNWNQELEDKLIKLYQQGFYVNIHDYI